MKKRKIIIIAAIFLPMILLTSFFAAYRYVGVGGRVIKVEADAGQGFYAEYYLLIPDRMEVRDHTYLLVAPNNTGRIDDNHKTHVDSAHDIVRFGQANRIARALGVPLLVPCFDRPAADWQMYTHALDRETLMCQEGDLARIDEQLLAMIADAKMLLAGKDIRVEDKVLLNGFSASGSFVNRFAALYPESVAAVAAGGVNSMTILPAAELQGQALIYPAGIADIGRLAGLEFQLPLFAAVPQFYYMGELDDNDALSYDDAYDDALREVITAVLGEEMSGRWKRCEEIYDSQQIRAEFHTYPGIGHETTAEQDQDIVLFFSRVMDESG